MNTQKSGNGGVVLSESFVKNVLPGLRADYLKIYIYTKSVSEADAKKVASVLGMDEAVVENAFVFFEELGLLGEKSGKFQSVPEEVRDDTPPEYNSDEVFDIIAGDEKLQMLLVTAQKILGRLPSANSTIILYGLYDWLSMSPELILRLLEYCAEMGKKDLRYAEKVAVSWHQMGITSCEMADEYIERQNKKNKYGYSLKKIFGITQRNYTPTEQRYVDSWYELGFSAELISYAFDYTVTQTNKLSFPYMNTVLLAWNDKGIKTEEQARESVESFKRAKSASKPKTGSKQNGKDYEIYKSGRYDFERIERMARQKIKESLREDK